VAIPPYTTATNGLSPSPTTSDPDANATANPFCNAGSVGDDQGTRLSRPGSESGASPLGQRRQRRLGSSRSRRAMRREQPADHAGIDDRAGGRVLMAMPIQPTERPARDEQPNAPTLQKAALALRKGLGVVVPVEIRATTRPRPWPTTRPSRWAESRSCASPGPLRAQRHRPEARQRALPERTQPAMPAARSSTRRELPTSTDSPTRRFR